MRKPLSIILLLLAAFTLVAHDLIPHQQHEDHICFEHAACRAEAEPSEGSEEPCCMLADLHLFAPADQLHLFNCSCCTHSNGVDAHLALIGCAPACVPESIASPLLFRKHPFLVLSFSFLALLSKGLRAPPMG